MSNQAVLKCDALNKVFSSGPQELHILKDISLEVSAGDRLAIVGASGSGKSTLLHCIGGLDDISSGSLWLQGVDYFRLNQNKRAGLRNRHLGFVYQFHHLLPEFTALENVAMPLLISGMNKKKAAEKSAAMLARTGLEQRIHHKPSELSGGERQRAAIARALVTEPSCLLADEPTGNLDRHTAEQIYELMLELNESSLTALIMVTHDEHLAQRMDRVLTLVDGQLQSAS
jgi:lipoprotein-releasing system ATP-binding protein